MRIQYFSKIVIWKKNINFMILCIINNIMPEEYLMNIASAMFLICYLPEFYANYRNKNANMYNVFEKIFMAGGTGFGLGYSLTTDSRALVFNYSTLFTLDMIALFMRAYYAYMNHGRETRLLLNNTDIENRDIEKNAVFNPVQNVE